MTKQNAPLITLAHISDFHLPIESPVPTYKLLSKRMLGYANLRFNRGKTHKKAPFLKLLAHLRDEHPSLCVATGDFVNLALKAEFTHLSELFLEHGFNDTNLFCIPGNHDRYTPGAQYRHDFESSFSRWIPFVYGDYQYPAYREIGPVALFGLNTAVWRGPIRAAGRIDRKQLKRLEDRLNRLDTHQIPVIAMHHPPFHVTGHQFKQYLDGLQNFEPLMKMLQGRKATVIHGHIHLLSDKLIGDVRVIGVPSASNDANTNQRQLAYNTLKFGPNGLQEVVCTRYWPDTESFEIFPLNENNTAL